MSISNNFVGHLPHFSFWQAGRFRIDLTAPKVMGILNLTPDSFSDGGVYSIPVKAIAKAESMLRDGADVIDVGAESTRPGASPISAQEEWGRLRPVLIELLRWEVPISLDTYRPETMEKALELGVDIINDIWALRQPQALEAVRQTECGLCLMHMQGKPSTMQMNPISCHAVEQVYEFFSERFQFLDEQGLNRRRCVLDPGIGFGKSHEQNLSLMRSQAELLKLGQPILIGWSRKSTLGHVTGQAVENRLIPSVTAALMAVERGARIVRVHDVAETKLALKTWQAVNLH